MNHPLVVLHGINLQLLAMNHPVVLLPGMNYPVVELSGMNHPLVHVQLPSMYQSLALLPGVHERYRASSEPSSVHCTGH